MRWGRFLSFILVVAIVIGLTAGTGQRLWKNIPLGLDLKGGFDLLYEIQPTKQDPLTNQGIQAALQAVELRVNSLGVSSPSIDLENGKYIRVDVATTMNQQQAEKIIGNTAELEIYGDAKQDKNGKWTPIGKPLITGKQVESNAQFAQDPNTGQNVVDITFKDKKLWQQITTKYLGKQIYTFLNGNMIMNATVQDVISNGQTELSGGQTFTPQYCQKLAKELNAGALPYPLKLVSSTNVGPSLGEASLKATLWAGLAAVALIFLFMLSVVPDGWPHCRIAFVAYGYLTLFTFSQAFTWC